MAYVEPLYDNSLTSADKEDIRAMYRNCLNKKKQIGILAELYLVNKETITQILGLDKMPGPKGRRSMRRKKGRST